MTRRREVIKSAEQKYQKPFWDVVEELYASGMSVTDIAYELGYESSSILYRMIRQTGKRHLLKRHGQHWSTAAKIEEVEAEFKKPFWELVEELAGKGLSIRKVAFEIGYHPPSFISLVCNNGKSGLFNYKSKVV